MANSESGQQCELETLGAKNKSFWRLIGLSALAAVVMLGMMALNDYKKSFVSPEKLRQAVVENPCVNDMVTHDLRKPVPLTQASATNDPEVFEKMLELSQLRPVAITNGRLDEMMGECKRLVKKSSEQDLNQEALERQRSALVGDFGK